MIPHLLRLPNCSPETWQHYMEVSELAAMTEVMESLLGKWKLIPDSVMGFEEFADELHFTPAAKERYLQQMPQPQTFSLEVRRDGASGDFYTIIVHSGDQAFVHTFKLGKKFHALSATGADSMNEYYVESHRQMLVGKHTTQGQTITSRRYLKNGNMVSEAETSSGVVSRMLLEKVPVEAPCRRDKRISSIVSDRAVIIPASSRSQ